MAVPVTTTPSFSHGSPQKLFRWSGFEGQWKSTDAAKHQYDVTADGQRFVMVEPRETPSAIRVVQNWFEEYRDEQGGAD